MPTMPTTNTTLPMLSRRWERVTRVTSRQQETVREDLGMLLETLGTEQKKPIGIGIGKATDNPTGSLTHVPPKLRARVAASPERVGGGDAEESSSASAAATAATASNKGDEKRKIS
eukprot:07764_2